MVPSQHRPLIADLASHKRFGKTKAIGFLRSGCELLDPTQSCELKLDGDVLGYIGSVTADGLKQFELRAPAVVAEAIVKAAETRPLEVYVPGWTRLASWLCVFWPGLIDFLITRRLVPSRRT